MSGRQTSYLPTKTKLYIEAATVETKGRQHEGTDPGNQQAGRLLRAWGRPRNPGKKKKLYRGALSDDPAGEPQLRPRTQRHNTRQKPQTYTTMAEEERPQENEGKVHLLDPASSKLHATRATATHADHSHDPRHL